MAQEAGGKLAAGVIDAYPRRIPQRVIELSVRRTNRLLGARLNQEEVGSYLKSIELEAKSLNEDRLRVVPPTFRVDLKRPEDLMEEVARLRGYDRIPTTHPLSHVMASPPDKTLQLRDRLRQVLVGCGFSEIVTYSFIAKDACDRLLVTKSDPRWKAVSILNPLTEDQGVMRTSLLYGLLTTMHKNSTQRNQNVKIFELGKIFLRAAREELPQEVEVISGLWTGARHESSWHFTEERVDDYDIKGVIDALCEALNVRGVRFAPASATDFPYFKPGHGAEVFVDDTSLGALGELSPAVLDNFDLKQPAFCFDLNFDQLVHCASEEKRAKPVSRFPATTRDVALIVDDAVLTQDVLDYIKELGQELLNAVAIFDMYQGPPIPEGKKSIALRFTFRSFERNLTDGEVNEIHEAMTREILKEFKAQLPPEGDD
jgi:phenylalanyl-tRNA synthetase beta chain